MTTRLHLPGLTPAMLLLAACTAHAQDPSAGSPPVTQALERVVVTGSLLSRTETETPLPVTVITREEIRRTGASTTLELISALAVVNGGANNSIAFGAAPSIPGQHAVGLRGLGPNATLVLVNGRRMSNHAFTDATSSASDAVDIDSIPLAAIDRVEVLRDGASSLYGSDAIAGVINFILREDFRGGEVTVRGADPRGRGASEKQAVLTLGFGSLEQDRFNIFATATVLRKSRLFARDREASSTVYRPEIGLNVLQSAAFPGNYSFDLTDPDSSFQAAPGCPVEVDANGSRLDPAGSGACVFDLARLTALVPSSERDSVLARATWAAGPGTSLYVEALASRYRERQLFVPSRITGSATPSGAPFVMPATSPFDSFGQDVAVETRLNQLGNRELDLESKQGRVLIGVKGDWQRWTYDGAVALARSRVTESFGSGWVSETSVREGLADGSINGLGASDITRLRQAEVRGTSHDSVAETRYVELRASRDLFKVADGWARLGIGTEYRRERLDERYSALINQGDVIGFGGTFLPVEGKRSVRAGFAELEVPLARSLTVDLSARAENYSDFGSTFNPKLSAKWLPLPQLLLRGSFGTGFRAPSLAQLVTPPTSYSDGGYDFLPDLLRCGRPGSDATDCSPVFDVVTGGNPGLEPEKSRQWNLGMVLAPTPATSLGLTWYSIHKKANIGSVDSFTALRDPTRYASIIVRGAPTASDVANGLPGRIESVLATNQNLGALRTSGLDLEAAWRAPTTSMGRLSIQYLGSHILSYRRDALEGEAQDVLALGLDTGVSLPRWRHNASAAWQARTWSVALGVESTSGYPDLVMPDPNTTATGTRDIGSFTVFHLNGRYEPLPSWSFELGVRNLFDRAPPAARGTLIGYDSAMHDIRGRTLYGSISYAWR